jgi:hypothetical protein
MKRYLLFCGDIYYPSGGWDDFVNYYDTIEEAREAVSKMPHDWWQIVDTTTMNMIVEGSNETE